jgi:hypothetical protein
MTAFVGNIFFEYEDDASPPVFQRVCQVFSISGVGETNALVDATTFCSGGSMEYIGGLSDGNEVNIELNWEQGATDIDALIAQVKAKTVRSYQLSVEQLSPAEVFSFDAIPLSWELGPSVDGRNTGTFSFKISGGITIV